MELFDFVLLSSVEGLEAVSRYHSNLFCFVIPSAVEGLSLKQKRIFPSIGARAQGLK
jgi:hypothetical protein